MDFVPGTITNIRGMRFGRLVAIAFLGIANHKAVWICQCDCGDIISTTGKRLRIGQTKSCGCLKPMVASARLLRHGHSRRTKPRHTREYSSWLNLRRRCSDSKDKDFKYYGGRGITVCERWNHSFDNFLADMGLCPPGLEIDRINTDGNYEPGNCRWTDDFTQARNRRPRQKGYHKKVRTK